MLCLIPNETSVAETRPLRFSDCREQAEEAVKDCLLAATESLPVFEFEVTLQSWLAGILVEEV